MNLHFDFRRDARRQSIYDQVVAQLSVSAQDKVTDEAGNLEVPDKHHNNLEEVLTTVRYLPVSDRVKQDMRDIYEILARAEAQVHGCSVEETHFHEVGRAAGIRNVAIICLCIEALNPEKITATPVQTGSGTVECAHGILDIPAPATAAILNTGIPVCEKKLEGELCTPTSAAIIKHFVSSFAD
ncbi:MAG: nickel insertion protein [Eggerthellaceae bacterium]|jgi:uncharacterized protein (DUF111 family)